MAIKIAPESEREYAPPLETSPRRFGGWLRRLQQRIKLAMAGDDEELVLHNKTAIAWRAYHNYHQLGIIDGGERRVFRVNKHGSLSVRPCEEGENVEYLVLPLDARVHHVHIYRRRMGKDIEVYDMRALLSSG
ncbi:MAG TPA: hypothetical protein VEU97_05120 [Ktedonobacteraceae bacterium]|nr:hypothetical protein [Ktedonobacteraceae bacterium]